MAKEKKHIGERQLSNGRMIDFYSQEVDTSHLHSVDKSFREHPPVQLWQLRGTELFGIVDQDESLDSCLKRLESEVLRENDFR